MDCIDHGVAKSPMWLSDFHFTQIRILSPVLIFTKTCSEYPDKDLCVFSVFIKFLVKIGESIFSSG